MKFKLPDGQTVTSDRFVAIYRSIGDDEEVILEDIFQVLIWPDGIYDVKVVSKLISEQERRFEKVRYGTDYPLWKYVLSTPSVESVPSYLHKDINSLESRFIKDYPPDDYSFVTCGRLSVAVDKLKKEMQRAV